MLTTTIPCLRYLAEHVNRDDQLVRLTSKYRWHCPGIRTVFSPCGERSKHHCIRLQELKVHDRSPRKTAISPDQRSIRDHPYGVVVFRYRKCTKDIDPSAALAPPQKRRKRTGPPRQSTSNMEDGGFVDDEPERSSTLPMHIQEPGPSSRSAPSQNVQTVQRQSHTRNRTLSTGQSTSLPSRPHQRHTQPEEKRPPYRNSRTREQDPCVIL